jgi:hypothetical protein
MGRVKMPWGKLEIGAQKEISLGLVRCLQSERNLYYNSFSNNMNKKDMKYKTQDNRNYNVNSNNINSNDNFNNEYENFNNKKDNDDNIKYDNNNNNNNENHLHDIEEAKEIAAKNRFIRHSKECLSILCKLGVTYEHLSVQLLQELILVSTDLMSIYVRSVNENERKSVNEINDKNRNNKNEISNTNTNTNTNNNFDDNSVISTGVKNIPPATLAAASLHWLSQMKIPYSALQLQHKNTVLRYLETVLHHSTKKGKSGISFPFLMSILTNLKISGIQYSDFDNGVKEKFEKFENFIEITKNKIKIENSVTNDKNINLNTNNAENILVGKIEEKSTQDVYIQKYESFMKSMNVPNEKYIKYNNKINDSIKNGALNNGEKECEEFNEVEKVYTTENEKEIMTENVINKDIEREKEQREKMKNNENEKLLHRLSLRVAALPDSDLLRVVFLLGHRKISLKQLRLAHKHTSTKPVIRENENTVLKSVNIPSENTYSDAIVHSSITDIGGISVLGSESYEVRESLLDVLDSRLETVLKDLSPGKRTYIMCTYALTFLLTCMHINISTYKHAHALT